MRTWRRVGAALGAAALLFGVAGVAGATQGNLSAGRGPGALAATGCGIVPLDVELIIDSSGSMGSNSSGSPAHTRMYWAQQAANQLVDSLDANGGVGSSGIHHVGVTRFSGTTSTVVGALGTSSASTVKGWINGLSASGNTPLKLGLATGAGDMSSNARNAVGGDVERVIILLTDGRPNPDGPVDGSYASSGTSQRPTQANVDAFLGAADVVYSIAIGQGGGSGSQLVDLGLMQLLDKPNGNYYNVVDASNLSGLFADIFKEIACPPHVTVKKSVDKSTAAPGDTLNYTITLSNDGGQDATGVAVHDDITALLAHGTFGTCDNSCSNDADSVDWTGLTVTKGGSLALHFSIDLAGSGWDVGTTHLPNTVVVSGTNCPPEVSVAADADCSTDTTVEILPTAPPTEAPTEAPTAEPTAPPTDAPTEVPTPTFTQEVGGLTDAPTEPPTDAVHASAAPTSEAAWLLVLALAGLLGTVVVLTPRSARRR